MVTVYTLNLSEAEQGRVDLADIDFAGPAVPIANLEGPITTDAAIVYILGHAVPNGLKVAPRKILTEGALVEKLRKLRQGTPTPPTLVILDACFAQSFQVLSGAAWPVEFGRIFSCKEHERSWHSGYPAPESLFSDAFNKAMKTCLELRSFQTLEHELSLRLGELQHPVIDASAYGFLHGVFLGSAS